MFPELLIPIIAQHKQVRHKTDYRMSIVKIKKLAVLFFLCKEHKRREIKRKYWVHPIFAQEMREKYGASNTLIKELHFHNDETFINYFRMNLETYETLLNIVGPYIRKQKYIRDPIPPNSRLQICLRYLATGDSMKSLCYTFRIGFSTMSRIVFETCEAIWTALRDEVFPQFNNDFWRNVANEFQEKWNFPHCIGAMDGKHVVIKVWYNV